MTSVDQDERVGLPLGDQPRSNDRLAERGRRGQHARVEGAQRRDGRFLLGRELAVEPDVEPHPMRAFVTHAHRHPVPTQQRPSLVQAAAGKREMIGEQFAAGDHTRLAVRRQAHGLGRVERWVLEGRQPREPGHEGRRQDGAVDIDLIAQDEIDLFRHRLGHRRVLGAARRRRRPGLGIVRVSGRRADARHIAIVPAGSEDLVNLGSRKAWQAGQVGPLVLVSPESGVDEHAVVRRPWSSLKGQSDEVAEPTRRQRILAREEAVVGPEADIRAALLSGANELARQPARPAGGHRLAEENPDVRAVARARALDSHGHAELSRRFAQRCDITHPGALVEVDGHEPAGVVRQHRVDAGGKGGAVRFTAAEQVGADHRVADRYERLVRAGPALHAGLAAEPGHPLVPAHRSVASFAAARVLPARGKNVRPASEKLPEKRDLRRRRGGPGDVGGRAADRLRFVTRLLCRRVLQFGQSRGEHCTFTVQLGQSPPQFAHVVVGRPGVRPRNALVAFRNF
jgi:hypothetical protein